MPVPLLPIWPSASTRRNSSSRLALGFITAAATGALFAQRTAAQQLFRASSFSSSSCPAGPGTRTKPHMAQQLFGGGDGVSVPAPSAPGAPATAAVIFLHGLGDTANGWAPAFPLRSTPHVATVLPTAARRPVSLNMGMSMPAWFDIVGLDMSAPDDAAGIDEATQRVGRILDALANPAPASSSSSSSSGLQQQPIPPSRVVLAGFSQGGAVALAAALTLARERPDAPPLAGVAALSSWLPLRDRFKEAPPNAPPFFLAHGKDDPVVAFQFGDMSAKRLRVMGASVEFKGYDRLAHSASQEELADFEAFVARVLPPL